MKTTPVKGMRDILPAEQRIRDHVQAKILETYRAAGFARISTPILEDMENLAKSEGGDNLNLIFEVLKRGEKLAQARAAGEPLSDMGLRYDLTLPLARYYAANREKLPVPFKVIQTDRCYRAERPQKGRLREFVQCDIDIFGDADLNAEVELIDVTARALLSVGFSDFTVRVNDRRLLRGMLEGIGFAPDTLDSVCVSFDKLDKIGPDGVAEELGEKGMPEVAVERLAELLEGDCPLESVAALCADKTLGDGVRYVVETARACAQGRYRVAYAPSLVRGQGYYTGTVFEIECADFPGAVAGGGRYDRMVEKFTGQAVPAVGFSIGFERICAILLERGFRVPDEKPALALLYRAGQDDFVDVLQKAALLRADYRVTVLAAAKKVARQLDRLAQTGTAAVCFYEKYPEVRALDEAR